MLKLPRPGDVEGRGAEVGVLRLRDGHAASVQGDAVTQRVTDLWTGYEHHAGRWYAMYCNVDLDQSERNKRDDLVWVRNNEVATAAAELAALRAKLDKVCEAGDALMRDVGEHATGAFLSADDLYDAIAAARDEVGE